MTGGLAYLPLGIHLGLTEAEYHADPSFSNSGIRNLRISPLTYWVKSPLNPSYEPDDSEAKDTGKAFHKRILGGAEVFQAAYAAKLDPADYPKALRSGEQLRAYCKELLLKQSGTLAEMSARIREVDAVVELWAEIEEDYLNAHQGKEFLPKSTMQQVELAAASLEADPETAKLFRLGFPEVSIFWQDEATGVRMKARLDYLTLAAVTDLKTFSNPQERPLLEAVANSLVNRGYGTQAVAYLDAVRQAKRMLLELGMKAVYFHEAMLDATFDFDTWFGKLAKSSEHRFVFIFQESGAVPNVDAVEFSRNINFFDIVEFSYRWGIDQYRQCMERWGPSVPWVAPRKVRKLEDEDLPLWAFK